MAESKGIDWSFRMAEAIEDSSELSTDISFKIEDDEEEEVKAHRLVLGMASKVFRKMLFVTGTADKESKEILVKETTVAAFRAMVDAIYNTQTIQESLEDKTVHEMFAVLYLVKKYEIPELVLATRDCLATFPLSEDVVLEVARDAMEYLYIFDEEAKELLLQCAKFLKPKFKDAKSVIKFGAANKEHGNTIVELFALMDECDNCSQIPCRDGQEVAEGEFRLGLKVACENSSRYWHGDYIGNRGTVASIGPVHHCFPGVRCCSDDGSAHSSVGRGSTRGRRDREYETRKIAAGQVYVQLKDCETGRGQINLQPGVAYRVKSIVGLNFRFDCKTP